MLACSSLAGTIAVTSGGSKAVYCGELGVRNFWRRQNEFEHDPANRPDGDNRGVADQDDLLGAGHASGAPVGGSSRARASISWSRGTAVNPSVTAITQKGLTAPKRGSTNHPQNKPRGAATAATAAGRTCARRTATPAGRYPPDGHVRREHAVRQGLPRRLFPVRPSASGRPRAIRAAGPFPAGCARASPTPRSSVRPQPRR